MRKSKLESAATRKRIVHSASSMFCRGGLSTTVGEVMVATGLTHGALYRHFTSKDELIAEACENCFASVVARIRTAAAAAGSGQELLAIAKEYSFCNHPFEGGHGCPLGSLGSELVRERDEIRQVATDGFIGLVDVVAN
ncbi:TetR/AcrR family transcriptional regulator [Caballeronia sp. LZ035]|uniref:TetR/AcrR family transcriptional regulator n=1 Tax=Caballeronia sp. LZ035 TaxID=3038568 RepID=UPI0038D473EE